MRDPDASLQLHEHAAIRTLKRPVSEFPFLTSELAAHWQARHVTVPYAIRGQTHIDAKRVAMVSQPAEWCDAQLFDAATLTLDLLAECVDAGFDLKDSSAWNIVFDGTRAQLCDHTSVVPLVDSRWWPAGQFSRHFLLPLLLSQQRGLLGSQCFKLWRDGVPPEAACQSLGLSRYFTRYWPLMAKARDAARRPQADAGAGGPRRQDCRAYRHRLIAGLRWMLQGLQPAAESEGGGSAWRNYASNRGHYASGGLEKKRHQIGTWLSSIQPQWVADLGANTGEFTQMALDAKAQVVAVDADHDAVQALYRRHPVSTHVFPFLLNLDDLCAGRGWLGVEHAGVVERFDRQFDVVMMLALVHHLMVSLAVPMSQVAQLARSMTRRWLIVEWIDSDDPQMKALCAQRCRDPAEFARPRQIEAFVDAGFRIEGSLDLAPTHRQLALLRCD